MSGDLPNQTQADDRAAPLNSAANSSSEQPAPSPNHAPPRNRVPMGITVGLWLLLASFLLIGLILSPPGALTLSAKLVLFSVYTIALPTAFVGVALLLNRFMGSQFAPFNALSLGIMSTLMLVIFLVGQTA